MVLIVPHQFAEGPAVGCIPSTLFGSFINVEIALVCGHGDEDYGTIRKYVHRLMVLLLLSCFTNLGCSLILPIVLL